MIRGETVTVIAREPAGRDEGNDVIWRDLDPVDVDDVLVGPGAQENSGESTRPDGITVDATLYLPRSYQGPNLRGARILMRGHEYHAVGDPIAYEGGVTPTRWNMSVQIARGEG